MTRSILFVCLGNICRSPTAEAVFTHHAQLANQVDLAVDSAGTGNWHQGHPPDQRATKHALKRGYDLTPLRARAVVPSDFDRFDLILAMDRSNLADLRAMAPANTTSEIRLFLEFGTSTTKEVPDPYYGGDQGFEHVLDLIEDASKGLLKALDEQR